MQSKATTVKKYLVELPADRRRAIEAIRKAILANIDERYEEGMQYGMIGYYVPHSVYPAGYYCDPEQPLPFICLASQKNYMSLYAMSLYSIGDDLKWFREAWAKTGKKLDMGKSCIRFQRLEDLPLELIGEAIKRVPVERHIAYYELGTAASKGRVVRQGTQRRPKTAAAKKASRPRKTVPRKRAT